MTSSIAGFLRLEGYRALELHLQTVGDYSPRDSEWNYSDVPHLNVVHTRVSGQALFCSQTVSSSLFLQRIGPFLFPASLHITHDNPGEHWYVLVILNLVVTVRTCHHIHPDGCCTTTGYLFHYRGPFGWLMAHLARFATRCNYGRLMLEDLPMREQRGRLRRRGIRFAFDCSELIGFTDTLNIHAQHVDARRLIRCATTTSVSLDVLPPLSELPDLLLRVVWTDEQVALWPLICPHEGAPLPPPCIDHKAVHCPWHGRQLKPLLLMPRVAGSSQLFTFCGQHLRATYEPGATPDTPARLHVSLLNAED